MSTMVNHLVAEVLALEVRLLACQARLAVSTDSEALHDLRTTVRRLRSVLRPLRGLHGVEALEAAAKDVGQLTTPLRDEQVLSAFLRKNGWRELAAVRDEHLDRVCPKVANTAQVTVLLALLGDFPALLRAQQRQGQLKGLRKRIGKRMDKQWSKLRKAMTDPGHDRHDLRLLIKRVRYAAEAYPELSHQPDKMHARLKAAQSALGKWHDHLQWLALAEQHADLAPCVAGWQLGIILAEQKGERALQKLSHACFGEDVIQAA